VFAQTRQVVERVSTPEARAWLRTGEGSAALLSGRWQEALAACQEAERVFSQECVGASWEVTSARWFRLWARGYLGQLRVLSQEVAAWLHDGEARGDLRALVGNCTGLAGLVWLAEDRPHEARRLASEAMERWSHAAFHVQHWWDLLGQTQIDLYLGDAERALERVGGAWPALEGSMLLMVQLTRIEARHLRARASLAVADATSRDDLVDAAERDARAIAKERMEWSAPIAKLILAAVAAQRRSDAAIACLKDAVAGFDAAEMSLYAAAARMRLGALVGGDEGRAHLDAARATFEEQRVTNVERMVRMLAPGFARSEGT
jgi:hypothetical protein